MRIKATHHEPASVEEDHQREWSITDWRIKAKGQRSARTLHVAVDFARDFRPAQAWKIPCRELSAGISNRECMQRR
jgi:hypothetical protein